MVWVGGGGCLYVSRMAWAVVWQVCPCVVWCYYDVGMRCVVEAEGTVVVVVVVVMCLRRSPSVRSKTLPCVCLTLNVHTGAFLNVLRERNEMHPPTHTHHHPDQHSTARYHHNNTHSPTLTHNTRTPHTTHVAIVIEKREKRDRQ